MLIIEIIDIRISEEDTPVSKVATSGKASIISRMAKMGQSILPKIPLTSTTDSEDTEVLILIFLLCLPLIIMTLINEIYDILFLQCVRADIIF